jgi:hypothetical protein
VNAQSLDRIRFVTEHFNELQGLRFEVPVGLFLMGYGGMHLFPAGPLTFLFFAVFMTGFLIVLRVGRRGAPYYREKFGEVEQLPVLYNVEPSVVSVYSPAGPAPLTPERRPVNPVTRWILIPAAVALTLFVILRAVSPSVEILTDSSLADPWRQFDTPVVEIGAPGVSLGASLVPALAQALYAVCGACFVGVWLWRGRRFSQSYYLVLGIPLLGLAAFGACLGPAMSALWHLGIARIARFFLLPLAYFSLAMLLCGAAIVIAGLLDHWQIVRVLRPVKEVEA